MSRYWFKPKRYGYGATPVTWQGWAVTLGIVLTMVGVSLYVRLAERSHSALAVLLAFDAVALAALLIISWRKTEGGLHWRWGKDQ